MVKLIPAKEHSENYGQCAPGIPRLHTAQPQLGPSSAPAQPHLSPPARPQLSPPAPLTSGLCRAQPILCTALGTRPTQREPDAAARSGACTAHAALRLRPRPRLSRSPALMLAARRTPHAARLSSASPHAAGPDANASHRTPSPSRRRPRALVRRRRRLGRG
jgi:hypothetical protein